MTVLAGVWLDSIDNPSGTPARLRDATVFEEDGVTLATLYLDKNKTPGPNPTATDELSNLEIWADPNNYVVECEGTTFPITIYPNVEEIATLHVGPTAPVDFKEGDLWIDNDAVPNISSSIVAQDEPPTPISINHLWLDTDATPVGQGYIASTEKGVALGVATLGADGKLTPSQSGTIPATTDGLLYVVAVGGNDADSGLSWGTAKATIAAAIAALPATGGLIEVGAGTFEITAELAPTTGCHIRGRGIGVTTIKVTSSNRGMLIQNVSKVVVSDLTIDMNMAAIADGGSDTQQLGIYMVASNSTGLSDITIERVQVINSHRDAFRSTSDTTSRPHRVKIRNCRASATKYGYRGSRPGGVSVEGCVFENITAEGIIISGGSIGDPGSEVLVANNRLINCVSGGVTTTTGLFNFQILGNYIEGTTGSLKWGIAISIRCHTFVIADNICANNTTGGITIDLKDVADETIYPAKGVVKGNVSYGGTVHGINVNYARQLTIMGNTCFDNAQSGIRLTGSECLVVGNHCFGNDKGIAASETTTPFGGHVLSGNRCKDNTTIQISIDQSIVSSIDDNVTVVRKTVNESINNVAVSQPDNELKLTLRKNETWKFEFFLVVNGGAVGATADFRAAITVPAGATFYATADGIGTGAVVYSSANRTIRASDTSGADMTNFGTLDAGNVPVRIYGTVVNGATGGELGLSWAQTTATVSDLTVLAGSVLEARRLV